MANDASNLRPARAQLAEPPYADPLVRWCGRGEQVTAPPIPIKVCFTSICVVLSRLSREPRKGQLQWLAFGSSPYRLFLLSPTVACRAFSSASHSPPSCLRISHISAYLVSFADCAENRQVKWQPINRRTVDRRFRQLQRRPLSRFPMRDQSVAINLIWMLAKALIRRQIWHRIRG